MTDEQALLIAAAILIRLGVSKARAVAEAIEMRAELRKHLENGTQKAVLHGKTCQKRAHYAGGAYAHSAWDDTQYDIDGVSYCGRCHEVLP